MSEPSSRFAAFIAELRRRRVFRVAIVYAGVAFIIFQIVDATFEPLHIPDWVSGLVIILLLLGFLVAVGMAWAFDLTAEGLVRAKPEREPTAAKAPHHIVIGNKTLAIVAAVAVAVAVWSWWGRPSAAGPITSIAVLPLDNLMNDPEQDYFVDGMHDALISELGKIGALRVIGRTSVLGYRDAPKPIPEIAQELKVDAVVEGSVLLVGGEVKITAQLVAASPERHLWTDSYTRRVSNVLSLHSDVARAIAGEIGLALTPEEEDYLARAPQVNPEGYNLYLKGWHFRNQENPESNQRAIEVLEQAVELDPDFAPAHAALAICYLMAGNWAFGIWDDPVSKARMKQAVDKALELDSCLPEAHLYLATYRYIYEWDFDGAEAAFRRALQLNPEHAHARYGYGLFLNRTGRHDEAMPQMLRAKELDPLSSQPEQGIARVYSRSRRYEQALEHFRAALELEPTNSMVQSWIKRTRFNLLYSQGQFEEAAALAEKEGRWHWWLRAEWALGKKNIVLGFLDSLRAIGQIHQLEQEYPSFAARVYATIGERKKALSLLEKAYADTIGLGLFVTLTTAPEFDSLRAEARFKALMQKLGLTEVFDQYGQRIR